MNKPLKIPREIWVNLSQISVNKWCAEPYTCKDPEQIISAMKNRIITAEAQAEEDLILFIVRKHGVEYV